MATFNAERYWFNRPVKVWVVTIRGGSCTLSRQMEERLVRSRRQLAAEDAALGLTFLRYPVVVGSRLATPDDLLDPLQA